MNWGLITTGFLLGTWKFMFAHWTVHLAFSAENFLDVLQIFISVTFGAWFCMAIFYFSSSYFMRRSAEKKKRKREEAIAAGKEVPPVKNFTKMNKAVVRLKRRFGIVGITFLAPLFLSIPIGTIVCAKFFGKEKITFWLMLLFSACYSAIMCTIILFTI